MPPTIPPQTLAFLRNTSKDSFRSILRSYEITIDDPKDALTPADYETRLKDLLADSQRLAQVLPLSSARYADLPEWSGPLPSAPTFNRRSDTTTTTAEDSSLVEVFSKCLTLSDALVGKGNRELGEDAFHDACQSLMAIAKSVDIGLPYNVLQDKRQTSGIALRVVKVKATAADQQLPILFVLFQHTLRPKTGEEEAAVYESPVVSWVMKSIAPEGRVNQITSELDEQYLLLRQLVYNSQRLPSGAEKMLLDARHKSAEMDMVPSFLLPLDPLIPQGRARLSEFTGCETCGRPASSFCGGCRTTAYCSSTCQRADYKAHKPLCKTISAAATTIVKVEESPYPGKSIFNINRHQSQRDVSRQTSQPQPSPSGGSEQRSGNEDWFLIKVQGQGAGPMMIYDSTRTFTRYLRQETDKNGHDTLRKLVENCVRWSGMKVYLRARHPSDGNGEKLEVMTGVLPSQEQAW